MAAAAHQIEGGNWNNDWWMFEHKPDTPCVEPSGDCTDSYHRYADDIALVRDHGFGAYRFSIEWSRIEPEDGEFSIAALDYYRRVLAECHEQGVQPVVTFHHFSNPRWLAALGGWESPEIVDRFTRYCERTVAHLGDLISIGCTINEPNILALMGYVVGVFPPGPRARHRRVRRGERPPRRVRTAARTTSSRAGAAISPSACVSRWATGGRPRAPRTCSPGRGTRTRASSSKRRGATTSSAYRRTRGPASTRPGSSGPRTASRSCRRWATSSGRSRSRSRSGSRPRRRRYRSTSPRTGSATTTTPAASRYVHEALEGVGRCLADGIDVRGYFYWSLLDNFEWALGYGPRFGLVSVTRDTFVRTPKPSAAWLGAHRPGQPARLARI